MIRRDDRCLLLGVFSVMLLVGVSACTSRAVRLSPEAQGTQSPPAPTVPLAATPKTPPDRYLSHIALLAHDELEGRDNGSRGIDLAAGYIAGQFAAAGLEPGGPDATYFQEFTISRPAELLDETDLTFQGASVDALVKADFTPFSFSAQGDFDGEMIFVGYGAANPDQEYDDYAGIDATDRVVLMLRREPPGWDPDGGYTDHARFDRKVKLAAEKGAAAVFVANQDPGEDGIDGLMRFRPRGEDHGLPALHVKRHLADELLAAGGLGSLTELQQQLDEEGRNVSAPLAGVRVAGTVAYESKDIPARNVIGVLPGTGTHADEYIVIGAHYDHVGVRRGQVCNGADDNASGTAGVIEAAWALARTPNRNRSVIFMAFAGEETGLHGSRHYVEEPTVDLDSVVAMLNFDMIGRLNPDNQANMLGIQGLGTGGSFKEIIERRTEEAGIEYLPEDSARGPSDHAPFYRADIPALFFHTGMHRDLHQPSDDTEKINAEGAAQIVDLAYHIVLDVMNEEDAPVFAQVDKRASIFRSTGPGHGVVMGVVPDMDDTSGAPGWRVVRVFPGSGADKAGMQSDDRIIRIDGLPISGLDEYRAATAHKEPGDVIQVTVRRGQEELILDVELSARRRP
ncbi:MAG: M28 family peptidase [Phycisphaerales bacterium]|nr:MAG: M28 family peptidase [Phycisphaerales bacterium]